MQMCGAHVWCCRCCRLYDFNGISQTKYTCSFFLTNPNAMPTKVKNKIEKFYFKFTLSGLLKSSTVSRCLISDRKMKPFTFSFNASRLSHVFSFDRFPNSSFLLSQNELRVNATAANSSLILPHVWLFDWCRQNQLYEFTHFDICSQA